MATEISEIGTKIIDYESKLQTSISEVSTNTETEISEIGAKMMD